MGGVKKIDSEAGSGSKD